VAKYETKETPGEAAARQAAQRQARDAADLAVYSSLAARDEHGRTIDEKIAVQDGKLVKLRAAGLAEGSGSIQAIVRLRAALLARRGQV
jgi:hypothetical protein